MWIFLCVLSAVFFALNHLVSKEFSKRKATTEFLPLIYLFALVLLLPFISFIEPIQDFFTFFKIIVFSVSTSLGTFLLFYTYSRTDISTASPLLNLSPVFLVVTSFIILGESLSLPVYFAVFLIVLGGYLITLNNCKDIFHPFTSIPKKYFTLILLTIILYSISAPVAKMSLETVGIYSFMFYTIFISCLLWFLIESLVKKHIFFKGLKQHWKLAFYGSFFFVGSELALFLALSLPEVLVSLAIPIRRVSSIFIVIAGGHIFHEGKIKQKLMASSIMLVGVFIIALN